MTRRRKQTVDYFPHICKHAKTMFILEQRYGNDGYAFWFKLLELLGTSEGHFIDCNDLSTREYLQSVTRTDANICTEILNLLSNLQAIDTQLWETSCIIWSDNFVKGLSDVYRNRRVENPIKPPIYTQESASNGITTPRNPQSKVKESKVKESNNPLTPLKGGDAIFDIFWKAYPKKIGKGAALKKWEGLKRTGKLPPVDTVLSAIENQKTWEQWQKDEGQFIPNPATWLNQGRWDDEPPEGGKPEWMRQLSQS